MPDCLSAASPSIEPTMEEWFGAGRKKVLKSRKENLQFLGFRQEGVDRLQLLFGQWPIG
jgi:hypothetical protein